MQVYFHLIYLCTCKTVNLLLKLPAKDIPWMSHGQIELEIFSILRTNQFVIFNAYIYILIAISTIHLSPPRSLYKYFIESRML